MNRTLALLTVLLLAAASLSAQSQATVREASGKVELQAAGGAWLPARVGAVVSLGTTISTGFNSTAVLDLGSSVLKVNPLTRMRLDQLVQEGGAVKTELFLRVGKVNAEVKTVAGVRQDFKLKSPVSTAAVRGTGFEYSGYELYVYEGTVTYSNLLDQGRSYAPGESGGSGGFEAPGQGEAGRLAGTGVNPYAPGAGGEGGRGLPGALIPAPTGGVILVIEPPLEAR